MNKYDYGDEKSFKEWLFNGRMHMRTSGVIIVASISGFVVGTFLANLFF